MIRWNRTLVLTLLALVGLSTVAAVKIKSKKTHMGVVTEQVVYLSTFNIDNDNSGGSEFYYDRQYPADGSSFTVPEGYSFVVTDIFIEPSGINVNPSAFYLASVSLNDNGARAFSARFSGTDKHHYALSGGLVIPSGATPTGRNSSFSSGDIEVELIGYFVEGKGLQAGQPVF